MEIRRLNTLRGLAALVVVVSHYSNESGLWNGILGKGAGQIGVMVFFLLSAFLMALLYGTQPASGTRIRLYAIARVARVVPLFLVVVLASYTIQKLQMPVAKDAAYLVMDERILAAHLLLLNGQSVLWTIPAEIHFYGLFVLLWLWRPWAGYAMAAVVLGIFFTGHWPKPPEPVVAGTYLIFNVVTALPYFSVGYLLGMHYRPRPLGAWVGACLLVPLLFYPEILKAVTGVTLDQWRSPLQLVCISAAFAAYVYCIPSRTGLWENRIGDGLGAISYSLYLLHYPLLHLLKSAGLVHGFGGLLLFVAGAICVAAVSYQYFELPARRVIRRFAFKREDPFARTGATSQAQA